MEPSPLEPVVRRLRHLAGAPGDEVTDTELLERFVQQQDESAFDGLLQRHGRMVLGTIRSFLHGPQDAEDAFQATFLVLARRADSVRKKHSLRSWLYGVAYRTALKARAAAQRRRRVEEEAAMSYSEISPPSSGSDERPILAEELHRLPDKYREPLLLCYLEGKTTEQAAQLLSWPQGTVKVRLMRGRDLLRNRLVRRGVTLSLAGLPTALADMTASAAVPTSLADSTLSVTHAFLATGQLGWASPAVAALTQGVLKAMWMTKLKTIAAMIALTLLLAGSGLLARQALADKADESAAQADEKAKPLAVPKPAISSKDQLTPETFARFRQFVRPNENELTWRRVRWLTDFWTARQKAAAEDKPILVFYAYGAGFFDPLGVC